MEQEYLLGKIKTNESNEVLQKKSPAGKMNFFF